MDVWGNPVGIGVVAPARPFLNHSPQVLQTKLADRICGPFSNPGSRAIQAPVEERLNVTLPSLYKIKFFSPKGTPNLLKSPPFFKIPLFL